MTTFPAIMPPYFKSPPPTFLPSDLSALSIWLKADTGVTLSGSNVTAWADQSGNGNNFSQSTGANQPTFSATAINGHPGIQFTAASSQFMNSNASNANLALTGSLREYSGFSVIINNSTAPVVASSFANPAVIADDPASGGDNLGQHIGSDKFIAYHWTGADTNVRPTVTTGTAIQVRNQYEIAVTTLTGKTPSQTLTNTSVLSGASSVSGVKIVIGSCSPPRHFFNGYIGEIVWYTRPLTSTEIGQVEGYLSSKWGV